VALFSGFFFTADKRRQTQTFADGGQLGVNFIYSLHAMLQASGVLSSVVPASGFSVDSFLPSIPVCSYFAERDRLKKNSNRYNTCCAIVIQQDFVPKLN